MTGLDLLGLRPGRLLTRLGLVAGFGNLVGQPDLGDGGWRWWRWRKWRSVYGRPCGLGSEDVLVVLLGRVAVSFLAFAGHTHGLVAHDALP